MSNPVPGVLAARGTRGRGRVVRAGAVRIGLDRSAVARRVNDVDQLLVGDAGGGGDAGGFQREVHQCRNTLELAELALHARHAGGAGHALDVQVDGAFGLLAGVLLGVHFKCPYTVLPTLCPACCLAWRVTCAPQRVAPGCAVPKCVIPGG